jgi:hypothetical protein
MVGMHASSMIIDEIRQLKESGHFMTRLDDDALAKGWNQILPDISPKQFHERIVQGTGDDTVRVEFDRETREIETRPFEGMKKKEGYGLSLRHEHVINDRMNFHIGDDGQLFMSRTDFKEGGAHTAKRYLRTAAEMFKEQNYPSIELTTAHVGGYAWAKFGFRPKDESEWNELRWCIKDRVKRGLFSSTVRYDEQNHSLNKAEVKIIEKIVDPNSTADMLNTCTDTLNRTLYRKDGHAITVGKALLFSQHWSAALPLDDNDKAYQRFMTYTASGRDLQRGDEHARV